MLKRTALVALTTAYLVLGIEAGAAQSEVVKWSSTADNDGAALLYGTQGDNTPEMDWYFYLRCSKRQQSATLEIWETLRFEEEPLRIELSAGQAKVAMLAKVGTEDAEGRIVAENIELQPALRVLSAKGALNIRIGFKTMTLPEKNRLQEVAKFGKGCR
jgi:hypothetical protein